MKVVHICTADSGGAGNAAIRLHLGLLKIGAESSFLCLHKTTKNIEVYQTPTKPVNLILKGLNKIGIPITSEQKNAKLLEKKGQFEIFSFPTSSLDISEHPLVKEADIINLHWVANFLDYPSFFSKVKKPIVWTLHDMNPFQGGFHYKQDLERNEHYSKLESRLRKIKKAAITNIRNLQIVAPSKWLKQESEQSELLGKFPHHHIPYGLDLGVFKYFPQDFARSVFNLPAEKKILLFVSDNVHNHRKGLDLLMEAIQHSLLCEEVVICAVGYIEQSTENQTIIHIGKVQDERLMPLLYSSADVLVLPSREDNFPNVMLEAMACGTPVIGFPIGGLLDIIEYGETGILASNVSSMALKNAIEDFFDHFTRYNRERIIDFATEKFGLIDQAIKYKELYNKMLENPGGLPEH